jgi:hypothetical protein
MGGPIRRDLLAMLKVCEALRDHTKDLMKANARSWTAGDENVSPCRSAIDQEVNPVGRRL